MTDVIVSTEAVEDVKPTELKPDALDDQLIGRLADHAMASGMRLTSEGGLQQLTKRVLGSAREGEITDHLSHEKAVGDNTRNGI